MNIAVVGSRTFTDRSVIERAIRRWMVLSPEGVTIVSGGATGADSLGEAIARDLSLPTIIHIPNWALYGKSAAFKRNMLIVADADVVLAFYAPGPKSRGTTHSVMEARIKGKPVHVYHEGTWS